MILKWNYPCCIKRGLNCVCVILCLQFLLTLTWLAISIGSNVTLYCFNKIDIGWIFFVQFLAAENTLPTADATKMGGRRSVKEALDLKEKGSKEISWKEADVLFLFVWQCSCLKANKWKEIFVSSNLGVINLYFCAS